ncbi:MAG: hypothetical protein KUL82_00485 [Bdellovibrio sp.]|uniref:hypothetical protein n=1 Tax=Bdellovibrio sp. TaxID=28201 RepID=UPI0039E54205|nr:hypothetical protein [Bdellovibrio sp.]
MGDNKELLTSNVPRTLETKSKIMGFELSDVLFLLLNLSIQNLIFGGTSMKIPMVFGTSLVLGLMLFFFKRGKPDNYIQHYFEHLLSPIVRPANASDETYKPLLKGGTNE